MNYKIDYKEVWNSCVDLSHTFPTIYPRPTCIWDVSFGWHKLLYEYGSRLEKASIEAYEKFSDEDKLIFEKPRVLYAKQKYGRLDICISPYSEEILDILEEIEEESLHTCEICGNGLARQESIYGWITTICEKCN